MGSQTPCSTLLPHLLTSKSCAAAFTGQLCTPSLCVKMFGSCSDGRVHLRWRGLFHVFIQSFSILFEDKTGKKRHPLTRTVRPIRCTPAGCGQVKTPAYLWAWSCLVTLSSCLAGLGYGSMHAAPHYKQLSRQPRTDGLWLLDIGTKEAKLLISIADLSHQLHRGPLSGPKDPITALPYNTTTGTDKTCPACTYLIQGLDLCVLL